MTLNRLGLLEVELEPRLYVQVIHAALCVERQKFTILEHKATKKTKISITTASHANPPCSVGAFQGKAAAGAAFV
jgi:hypothetical protein